jgi:hypothetical protein
VNLRAARDYLVRVRGWPADVAARAAPLVQERFRADATTRRGNVPSFGRMGNVPIIAEPGPDYIRVEGPDWCIRKAIDKGQVEQWADIMRAAAEEAKP